MTDSASASSASRHAWLVVALLVPVALLNYLDRQMLASMKFSVMRDIPDIALEANWGAILALFKWVYAFLSPVGGYLADRYSRRHVIAGSLLVWSAVTWTTGHVTSYEQLLATRALMGISEAFYIPAALALIADFHTGPTRSRAVGLHQMGIYVGVIVGGFGGYVGRPSRPRLALGVRRLRPGRHALRACRCSCSLEARPVPADAPHAPRPSPGGALRELLGNGSFILLVLYFTLPALAGWVVRDWMPAILKAEFGIGQGLAGVSATLYWQSAAIVGAIAGGWLADRWMRRSPRGRIFVSAIGMVAHRAGDVRRRLRAADRPAVGGDRVPDPVRPRLGLLRLQQHADPLPDRAARAARHRLRHHEPGQHQLRRLRRLGLRHAARPARAAVRASSALRQRGRVLDAARAADSPAEPEWRR